MRKSFLLIVSLFTLVCVNQGIAQKKLWRVIKFKKYPNTAYTLQKAQPTKDAKPALRFRAADFRSVLIEGARDKKIKVYQYTGKFNDITNPLSPGQLAGLLADYDKAPATTRDGGYFGEMELHEDYFPAKKQFDIKGLALIANVAPGKYIRLQFDYAEAGKYLQKVYDNSRKQQRYELLKAFWQSPTDPTVQMSVPEAFKQRKFRSYVPRSLGLPLPALAMLQRQPEYSPLPPADTDALRPKFIRINAQTVRTSIKYRIDLKQVDNLPLYQKGDGLAAEIIQGVKDSIIQPYQTNKPGKKISIEQFLTQATYSIKEGDTTEVKPAQLSKIDLKGWLDINTQTNERKFTVSSIVMMIPKGTNAETEKRSLMLAQFDYNKLKAYWSKRYEAAQKAKKDEDKLKSTWVNPQKPGEKMSFGEAIDKGIFKGKITWFATPSGNKLKTLLKVNKSGKKFNEVEQQVKAYLGSYGKK